MWSRCSPIAGKRGGSTSGCFERRRRSHSPAGYRSRKRRRVQSGRVQCELPSGQSQRQSPRDPEPRSRRSDAMTTERGYLLVAFPSRKGPEQSGRGRSEEARRDYWRDGEESTLRVPLQRWLPPRGSRFAFQTSRPIFRDCVATILPAVLAFWTHHPLYPGSSRSAARRVEGG